MQKVMELITGLKQHYNSNPFIFQTNISMRLSGERAANERQAIIAALTGIKKPASKCTLSAVSDALKAHYEQTSLF